MNVKTLKEVTTVLRPATVNDIFKTSEISFDKAGKKKRVLRYGTSYWLKQSNGITFDNAPYIIDHYFDYPEFKNLFERGQVYVALSNMQYINELKPMLESQNQPAS